MKKLGWVMECKVCGEAQMYTNSGMVCINGHGGAPARSIQVEYDTEKRSTVVYPTGTSDDPATCIAQHKALQKSMKKV